MEKFGFFSGMIYGGKENFDDFKKYKNSIPKKHIIDYISKLNISCCCTCITKDIFTGKIIPNAGIYEDGDFMFPTDFLHYLKNYDIGIPYKYEQYIKNNI